MCQEYKGDFEGSLVQLVAAATKLERKINLNLRHEESVRRVRRCMWRAQIANHPVQFSAVLTMRDSRTSIRQNETVQRLTYLTIGYLPITLIVVSSHSAMPKLLGDADGFLLPRRYMPSPLTTSTLYRLASPCPSSSIRSSSCPSSRTSWLSTSSAFWTSFRRAGISLGASSAPRSLQWMLCLLPENFGGGYDSCRKVWTMKRSL